MMNYSWKTAAVCTLLLMGGGVVAESQQAQQEYEEALQLTPNLDNGKKVYKICAVCHEPEGWGLVNGHYPQVAGQLNTVVIKQLADIRARNRDNPTMLPFTSASLLGGVQEIADVSAYIARGRGPTWKGVKSCTRKTVPSVTVTTEKATGRTISPPSMPSTINTWCGNSSGSRPVVAEMRIRRW